MIAVPVEFDSAVVLRCSDEERLKIGRMAQIHGLDVSAFARYAILEYIAAYAGEVLEDGDE